MKNYEKIYVGKGRTPNTNFDIVRITMKMADLQEVAYEYEGEMMVTLEVARMKQPDGYNRTHTVYATVASTEDTPVIEDEKPIKKSRKK